MEDRLLIPEPTRVYFPGPLTESDLTRIRSFLTFKDQSTMYQIFKLKQNYRWKRSNPESFQARLDILNAQTTRCLLFQDHVGEYYTYSGLAKELSQHFGWPIENTIKYPESKALPWAKTPYTMYPYQQEGHGALVASRHGSTEIPTGGGKTLIIDNLIKTHGLKSLIVTPSRSITNQIYNELKVLFGAKYVGMYGGTTKKTNKLITVTTAQTLTRLSPESQDYKDFSENVKVLIFDEAHTIPCDTFEKVCMGVARHSPYRYFVSATQMSNNGSEMILKGVTGEIVYRKTAKELIDAGYLAKPIFKIFHVASNPSGIVNAEDVHKETRAQLFCNPNVLSLAADIASKTSRLANRQVLILIDEFSQYELLKNYLSDAHTFVSGETKAKERQQVFKDFNEGKIRVLVGTSAISVGVDLKPVGCLIYLQGGRSEIQIKQAIGRGTRIVPGKKDFWVVDFSIRGSAKMVKHAQARMAIYEEYSPVEVIDYV